MQGASEATMQRRATRTVALLLGLGWLGATACGDIPIENELPPAGVIEGTVVYTGPLPCVQRGHVLGAALMLVFNEDLLPPPEGLGTTARSLATVPGDVLFAGVTASLPATSKDSDEVRCPAADAPPVTVSARWTVGPLPAGRYQVRGFYDRDGDFSPVLKTHNLPTAGDVGGGAVANGAAVLAGAAPVYQTIELGVRGADGKLAIPRLGALVDGVTVNLGLVLPTGRPVAHVAGVIDERPGVATPQTDPAAVKMPVDMRFVRSPTLNPAQADKEFLRLLLKPGVPEAEVAPGQASPLLLQVGPHFAKLYMTAGRDASGAVVGTPEGAKPAIADLFPQVIFSKINERGDPTLLSSQGEPAVISGGLVVDDRLLSTTAAAWEKKGVVAVDELRVLMRPTVFCTRPGDPEAPLYLVTPSFRSLPTDKEPGGEVVVGNFETLRATLGARFGKAPGQVKVVEGCLPPGKFGINLVYSTGQAWSLPNEAGVCQAPQEVPEGGGCKQEGQAPRPLLPSQRAYVTFGGVQEEGYCEQIAQRASAAAPANGADRLEPDQYVAGVPVVCLTQAEQEDPAGLRGQMSKSP